MEQPEPVTPTPEPAIAADSSVVPARNRRRIKLGRVKSDKMEQTIVVVTETRVPHPTYKKIVRKSVSFKAHDDKNDAKIGDTVRIIETRPISRDKRWRLLEIVERAK